MVTRLFPTLSKKKQTGAEAPVRPAWIVSTRQNRYCAVATTVRGSPTRIWPALVAEA